jgi:hypothetical protein
LPACLSAHTTLSIPALGAFQLQLTPFNSTPTAAKTALLRACGDADERALTNDGPSPSLMCAVRVATANDTEVIALAEGLYAFDPERDERDDEYDQDGNKARSIRTTLAGPRATDRGFFDPDAPRRLSSTNQLTLPRTPTPTSVVASRGP